MCPALQVRAYLDDDRDALVPSGHSPACKLGPTWTMTGMHPWSMASSMRALKPSPGSTPQKSEEASWRERKGQEGGEPKGLFIR